LEAATSLGKRGYEVTLTEATREMGGRVTLESALPGLAAWARVRDWRLNQIGKLPNVEY
jgi:dimethylamine/trimethylamine dehydrogenase